MIQWEYRIEHGLRLNLDDLNRYGKEGWELATIIFTNQSAIGKCYYDYVLKRPIEPPQQSPIETKPA